MNRALWFVSVTLALTGCHTARKVAVTSFRVVDAPANYIRHKLDQSDGQVTTTTTTVTSDVSNPGYVVTQPAPPPVVRTERRPTLPSPTPRPRSSVPPKRTAPTASPRTSVPPAQFPVARPVPGRPGYVYSLDPNGGMIDVTGYKSGDRAKDPYTKQIFIVP